MSKIQQQLRINGKNVIVEYDKTGETIIANDDKGNEATLELAELNYIHAYMFYKTGGEIYGIELDEDQAVDLTTYLFQQYHTQVRDLADKMGKEPHKLTLHHRPKPVSPEQKQRNIDNLVRDEGEQLYEFPDDWRKWDIDTFNKFMDYWLGGNENGTERES